MYKTPDVYVEEVSIFPPSVAQVETAVPAFVGYTEKSSFKGKDLTMVPTRITSMLEFEERFGGPPEVEITKVVLNANYGVEDVVMDQKFYLYDSMRLFFSNGGGKCYIVSVGPYSASVVDVENMKEGLGKLEKVDEPTLLLFPDGVLLDPGELITLQQRALAQCGKLKDRFSILDIQEDHSQNLKDDVEGFRSAIGMSHLKYGAAYTPFLETSLPKKVTFAQLKDSLKDENGTTVLFQEIITNSDAADLLADLENVNAFLTALTVFGGSKGEAAFDAEKVKYLQALKDLLASLAPKAPKIQSQNENDDQGGNTPEPTLEETAMINAYKDLFEFLYHIAKTVDKAWANLAPGPLKQVEETLGSINGFFQDIKTKDEEFATIFGKDTHSVLSTIEYTWIKLTFLESETLKKRKTRTKKAATPMSQLNIAPGDLDLDPVTASFEDINRTLQKILDDIEAQRISLNTALSENSPTYKNIRDGVAGALTTLPPSGAVAGIYADVDRTRGVWKAPANRSISNVSGLTRIIDNGEQEELNVDVNAGKSINAIRPFTGKGVMVWGARTLAGNDNEWRYIPVRRLFNMIEESVKKSTYWAVFETNDANLWVKVKGMIDNFLTGLWRDGALAGSKPDQAFFVHVGLGTTMTPQDILEGRLIVEIGLAAVRPAEFIILRFSHKLQEA